MDDREYHKGLGFGMAGLDKLLELARPAMQDPNSCEWLYDLARSAVLRLLRCDRMEAEVETWKEGLSRISALARGSHAGAGSDYLVLVSSRFEALAHLLADQNAWRANYSLRRILEFPFVVPTVLFLSERRPVKMADYLNALGTRDTSAVSTLAELRLLTWDESVKGEILIWLTANGNLLAQDLKTEAKNRAKS